MDSEDAIKVSGTTVIDNDRNANAGIVTATSLDIDPLPITFSPTDGSSDNALDTNIVITYNASVAKGSGNITLREGSASGTVIETIAVSSGTVSISAGQVTINPASDLPTGKDIYVVVDEGAFVQSNTDLGGSSPLLNTYNFTTGLLQQSPFLLLMVLQILMSPKILPFTLVKTYQKEVVILPSEVVVHQEQFSKLSM